MPKSADNCRLSRKQEQAVLELLNPCHRTQLEIAKKLGISERTLRYWQSLPQFQDRLQQEKKQLFKQGLDNLRANFHLAAQTLGTLLVDKSPVIRLRASQTIVDYNLKLQEQGSGKQPQHPDDEYYAQIQTLLHK